MRVAEQSIQRALEADPSLIEPGLTFVSREKSPDGKRQSRIDLIFRDSKGGHLLVELKRGAITDPDVGQIVRYLGMWLKRNRSQQVPVRTMLIGTAISSNLLEGLGACGIECKVLSEDIIARITADDEKKTSGISKHPRKRNSGGDAVIHIGRRKIGPTTFPDAMRQLYLWLIMGLKIEPEELISCSNPGGPKRKTRFEVQRGRKTRDSFAAVAAEDLCDKDEFQVFHVGEKTCGLTTRWAHGGSSRVIRELNRKFPRLGIILAS